MKRILAAFLLVLASPLWSQAGTMMFGVELGAANVPHINQGAVDLAVGPTSHSERTNYTPFDQYDWLLHIGAGLYNGFYPGFKIGVTSTGGAFFDPYAGITALVLAGPEDDDELDLSYGEEREDPFWVLGLIPEVGIRLNYPVSEKLKMFASLSWSLPMTAAPWGAAVSLTTQVGLGAFLY